MILTGRRTYFVPKHVCLKNIKLTKFLFGLFCIIFSPFCRSSDGGRHWNAILESVFTECELSQIDTHLFALICISSSRLLFIFPMWWLRALSLVAIPYLHCELGWMYSGTTVYSVPINLGLPCHGAYFLQSI